jgi:hypothetical protein
LKYSHTVMSRSKYSHTAMSRFRPAHAFSTFLVLLSFHSRCLQFLSWLAYALASAQLLW